MSQTSHSFNEAKHSSPNPFMRFALRQFHSEVMRHLPSDADTVLEVGCGEGYSAEAVLSTSVRSHLYGGDLSIRAIEHARMRFPRMHYAQIDATRLPYPSQSVDVIISLEVLEHLPNPDRAIAEMRRVARRYLLLSVPNDPIFRLLRLASGKGWDRLGDHPEHVQHWNKQSFPKFLAANQLRVLTATSPFPFSWTVVLCSVNDFTPNE